MKIGKTIKILRKECGIKQKVLADKCGITQSYLSMIENDKKDPTISVLYTITKELNTTLSILFYNSSSELDKRTTLISISNSYVSFITESTLNLKENNE